MSGLLARIANALINPLLRFLAKTFSNWLRKKQIEREVDDETVELVELRKQADQYFKENPDAKSLPPNLREKFMRAARRRTTGL